ncbi:MAG: type II toxin-antitoxin system prevent-host-death family antitoxin [Deltaproteobacteria bacterium]|nr:type II toxin-antitoxin system prevent-host-death family antitoxin [Deltaproteobacteria bacterium]
MQEIKVGVREAKINLSKLLKMVKHGAQVTLTDRNRPVGKIVPIQDNILPLKDRIKDLEYRGIIEAFKRKKPVKIPPPIPLPDELAQRLLQRDREDE